MNQGEAAGGAGAKWTAPPWAQRIGLTIGLLLLAAAVAVVLFQRDQIAAALAALREPSIALIAVLLASVAVNLILSSLTFSVLFSRYAPGRVGILEMQALISSTALVNFLPLRPGLVGRIAYHRAVNKIPVLDSAKVLVQGAALTVGAAALLAAIALLAHRAGLRIEMIILLPGALLTLGGLIPVAEVRIWSLAGLIRYVEVLVWAVRYLAAFALIGSPIEPAAAIGLACVSILATMVPLFSNGLGLREWLVGLLAPTIAGFRLELGLTAELVNRAAELIMVLTLGSIGMLWLSVRARTTSASP